MSAKTKKKSIKGTKTEINLANAYMAEAQAYARYTYYAQQADKENYFPIGEVFRETAANELRHGKVYFKFLEGGSLDTKLSVDAGVIGTTAENLAIAIHEERDRRRRFLRQGCRGCQGRRFRRNSRTFQRHRRNREAPHGALREISQAGTGRNRMEA